MVGDNHRVIVETAAGNPGARILELSAPENTRLVQTAKADNAV